MLHLAAAADPGLRMRRAAFERFHAARMATKAARAVPKRVTMPVVVHVLRRTGADRVSDAQISSRSDALHRDFAARNDDRVAVPAPWKPLVTDSRIRFALARREPDGRATSGVTRTKTKKKSFRFEANEMTFSARGGHDAWPSDRYVNLWVCSLGDDLLGRRRGRRHAEPAAREHGEAGVPPPPLRGFGARRHVHERHGRCG